MFERRMRIFSSLLGLLAVLLVVRMVDLQVLRADDFAALADRLLTRPIRYLKAPRGSIYDRTGQLLVADEPAFDIGIHYAILSGDDERYLKALARQMKERGDFPPDRPTADIVADFHAQIDAMWPRLAQLAHVPPPELDRNIAAIVDRVARVREYILARSRTIRAIAEEHEYHPVLEAVPNDVALAVRLELEKLPWLQVSPGSRRIAHADQTLTHVLGRLGEVSPSRIDDDPLAGSELRRLRPGDPVGVSGVERLGELILRGTRGRIVEDIDRVEREHLDPVQGEDIHLTLDATLQRDIYATLAEAVKQSDHPCGASAVVLDVMTGEVLALVSYPSYAYEDFRPRYDELRRDVIRDPLRFRAVSAVYPPGSTCKLITVYGGLASGVVSPTERIHCTGHLLPDKPGIFRCWIFNRYHTTHDASGFPNGLTAADAIRSSCNIYMFRVGERLGPQRLSEWFERFGLGHAQGTGLIEESPGIIPSEEWLIRYRGQGYVPADPWNWSIGQGEISATPLQVANVAATVARGQWRPLVIARDDRGRLLGDAVALGERLDERWLREIRTGMWRVVNERGATATRAQLDSPAYELCGKTGSAQAIPRALTRRWFLEWPGGRREEVVAGLDENDLLARYAGRDEQPTIVGYRTEGRFPDQPEDAALPSHAWFIGYTQRKDTPRGAAPRGRVYAVSVIIEFAGSGGGVAGPVAKTICERVLGDSDAEPAEVGWSRPTP